MRRCKSVSWVIGFVFILVLSCYGTGYGQDLVEITQVFTTDFSGQVKTVFHPGDNVRYHVFFDLAGTEKTRVVGKGTAKGSEIKPGGDAGVFKTDLEKQKKRLKAGTHTFTWDESIPPGALAGAVVYDIMVRIKDGERGTETGFLTIEEAPSRIAFVREEITETGSEAEAEPIVSREIWIMNPDGTDQVQVTFDPADDRNPSLSPNGMQIAFDSDRTGDFDIWILDLETGALTQLTDHAADDLQPEWSPDGKKIAFTSKRGGSKDVWVVDVDSGDLEQLTFSNFTEKGPRWAQNGNRILYVSDKDGKDDIHKMTSKGRKKEQLTFDVGDQRGPSWSEATKEIVFAWWEFSKSRTNIYVMDKNGENVRQLTSRKVYDRGPTWSPNGARIAFNTNRAGNFDIWTMKPDGTDMVQITTATAKETGADWKKTGFSDEWMDDSVVAGKGKENIVYVGTVHLAKGGALTVEMSWEDAADLDLGILEPDGTLITWRNPEGFGRHQGNVIPGPGTEIYTLSGAPQGDYRIGAYYKNDETLADWRVRWRDGSFELTEKPK